MIFPDVLRRVPRSERFFFTLMLACALLGLVADSHVAQSQEVARSPVIVVDQRGKSVTLPAPPQRIVTIPIPAASKIMTVDGKVDRLVGMHPSAKEAIEQGILGTIFPAAKTVRSDVTGQNFMPNVESLLLVRPDVVVQWANQGADLIPAVERLGLPVLGINYGTEELARGALTMYGKLLGKEARAAELIAYRDEVLKRLDAALSGVAEEANPRVLHLQRGLGLFQAAGGKDSYQGSNILRAGGRNVAGDLTGFVTVGVEQIVAWNPDVILLNSFEAKLFPQDIYDNPTLAGVSAVKNRRVYKLPLGGYRWDPPSQESPLTWLWQAGLYHPDRVKDDLRAEMKRAYRLFYDHPLSDAEIDAILFLDKHPKAMGYDRLVAAR